MVVIIDLMDPSTLGYYFQLAALSLSGVRDVGLALSFDDPSKYVNAVATAIEKVYDLKTGISFTLRSSKSICDAIKTSNITIDSPKYTYNNQVDNKAVQQAGLQSVCGQSINRNLALLSLSYLEKILVKNGPLNVKDVEIPMLFRATFFSKTRGPIVSDLKSVSADSLGLALIGALASFLGRVRVENSTYEYYLLPDGSQTSMTHYPELLEVLAGVIECPHVDMSIIDAVRVAINNPGVSMDTATYTAAIWRVASASTCLDEIESFAKGKLFESLLIVKLETSGNRPQVLWASTLAISDATRKFIENWRMREALQRLFNLSRRTRRLKREEDRRHLQNALATCVNSFSTMILIPAGDTAGDTLRYQLLSDCSRSLAAASDILVKSGDEAARELAERVAETLTLLRV